MDDTEVTGRISSFMETGRQNMREAAGALSKIYESKQAGRHRRSAKISRPPAGVTIAEGDIVLARERDCSLFRQGLGREFGTRKMDWSMDCHKGRAQGPERGHRYGREKKTIPHGVRIINQAFL